MTTTIQSGLRKRTLGFFKKQFILCVYLSCLLSFKVWAANGAPKMLLRMVAEGTAMQNETVVYFDNSGSFTYNPFADALSLGTDSGYLNIVSRLCNMDFQIKALPELTQNISLPIKITTGTTGQYQVYANTIESLPMGACLFLNDSYTGVSWDLRGGAYACLISDTETVTRFTLNITVAGIGALSQNYFHPTCASSQNGKIIADAPGAGPRNYYWKDSMNNILRTTLNINTSDTLDGLNAGFYRVEINPAGTCGNGTIDLVLKGTSSPLAFFSADSITSTFANLAFVNSSMRADSYWWDFGDGVGCTDTNALHVYTATNVYTVSLSAYSSVCNETSTYLKEITVFGTTALNETGELKNCVISRDQQGYYILFSYKESTKVYITVTDIEGNNLLGPEQKNVCNEKIRVDLDTLKNKLLIICVTTAAGHKVYKKIVE